MSKKIVVAGGGIAGLEAALRLEKNLEEEIKLVEPREEMLFYPSLHKVIEGEKPGKTVINHSKKFEERNINHIKTKLTGIEPEKKFITTGKGREDFDKLVLALGAETNFFDIESSECLTLRQMKHVKKIRRKIEEGVEKTVVVGGGATGVEAAASLSEAAKSFGFEVELVQASDRLLPQNIPATRRKAEKILKNKGVEVRKNSKAVEVSESSIKVGSGEEISADLTIWAAGVKPQAVVKDFGLPSTRNGVQVNSRMKVKGSEDIYSVGDVCDYNGKENRAYFALSEAKTAAKNIKAEIQGGKKAENSFVWDPQVIYLGGRTSLMEVADYCFSGFLPHIVREYFVDKRYLVLRRHLI